MPDSKSEIIDAWPNCPRCNAPRTALCFTCGEERDFFPTAYQVDENAGPLRFCSACDDVTQLRYARECQECGHDYGEGYVPHSEPPAEDTRRAMGLLWLLVAGGGLLAIYFVWLVRR